MTQEDTNLLLRDLCARLPYGVIVQDRNGVQKLTTGNTEFVDLFNGKCNIKPYLRPMSDMTRDEEDLYCRYLDTQRYIGTPILTDLLDWLNAHHIDYRQLIEQGLALEAPKDMYDLNNERRQK